MPDELETTAPMLAGRELGTSSNDFVVAEWREPAAVPGEPPRLIAPLHVHHADDEAWYVLAGKLCVKRGDEVVTVRAGAGVLVPKGMPHTFWNPDTKAARYLLIMPARLRKLIEELHRPGRTKTAAEVFLDHESELC